MGKQTQQLRKNKNRGYMLLRVWTDAVELYKNISIIFKKFPYELRRVASQAIASADSVHRNIAEGYCRRSIKEYIQFLYIALGSVGESVSGFHACYRASQISEQDFDKLDMLAYKLENGLLKLIESLENKKASGDWIDHIGVKEPEEFYIAQ